MYGSVRKGQNYTRFSIEVRFEDNIVAIQNIVLPNNELELYPKLYGWTLDRMTAELDKRIKERHREWLR